MLVQYESAYNKKKTDLRITSRDVIVVTDLFGSSSDLSIYNQLIEEIQKADNGCAAYSFCFLIEWTTVAPKKPVLGGQYFALLSSIIF